MKKEAKVISLQNQLKISESEKNEPYQLLNEFYKELMKIDQLIPDELKLNVKIQE